jgi:hypothetical protein
VDAAMVGEISKHELTSQPTHFEELCRRLAGGLPLLLFGGWDSFGAAGWADLPWLPALGIGLEHGDDIVQTFVDPRATPLGKRLGLLDAEELGVTAGYHKLAYFHEDRVLLEGVDPQGNIVPLLLIGPTVRRLIFTGSLLPTGGKRLTFSPGFGPLLHWLVATLVDHEVHVAAPTHWGRSCGHTPREARLRGFSARRSLLSETQIQAIRHSLGSLLALLVSGS